MQISAHQQNCLANLKSHEVWIESSSIHLSTLEKEETCQVPDTVCCSLSSLSLSARKYINARVLPKYVRNSYWSVAE
jgi:phospholipid N-methyltransferase